MRHRYFWAIVALGTAWAALLAFLRFCQRETVVIVTRSGEKYGHHHRHEALDFVPHPFYGDCNELFTGRALANYTVSLKYSTLYVEFQKAIMQHKLSEGTSGTLPKQLLALHYLAARPSVRNVCETGFNMGHSSFNFLTASPHTVVHSFDLGRHQYAKSMAQFMADHFPGRFFINFGDSVSTVPAFIHSNPDFRCDLIFVDGGHTYKTAYADLRNLISVANKSNCDSIIILDDYPAITSGIRGIGNAWEDVRRKNSIVELMRCMFSHKESVPFPAPIRGEYRRGFVVGMLT